MKAICLFFEVHQPLRLKRYRFFEIGNDHNYYDDFTNEHILRKVADRCYLPSNEILLDLIEKHQGEFKVSFSLTGVVLDQLESYAPDVLDSFKKLAETGHVEFLAETYSHSLACMSNREEFTKQIAMHSSRIRDLFGNTPRSFRNTEMVYSDKIGEWVADMGFKSILTEGAKHILGWRSPDYLYCNSVNPKLKVLLRNFSLSDDIAFRFGNRDWSEWPLTVDKFARWLKGRDKAELVNLFLNYETFGEHQDAGTGIFNFLKSLPGIILKKTPYRFMTPSEIADKFQPVSAIQVPTPISWADEERDLTAWLGNDLQDAAFGKLYELADKMAKCNNEELKRDWNYLQASDHFYYMCTKFFSDGAVHAYFNPYESPYDAFMNYMNVLSDFEERLDAACPGNGVDMELANLRKKIEKKDEQIEKQEAEIHTLRSKLKSQSTRKSSSEVKKGTGAAAKRTTTRKPK
ncbi:MAG TPA: glycoside hydrolase family 57 protein [Bacteroidales bacterium]|nr:glycoside hydrolase family 57 protein [Bacteroidales bacterium]